MSMKAVFLSLCVALAFSMVGCGRSKPESSKAATAEAVTEQEATPSPPDAPPPKATAAPVAVKPVAAPPQPVSFTPLPPGKDPPGDAERQKLNAIRAKQAEALKHEQEQRAAQLRNQPESNDAQ